MNSAKYAILVPWIETDDGDALLLEVRSQLVKQPGFPSIRIGTRILIPIDAFREWLVITSNKEE